MRFTEIINEAATAQVFHYTGLNSAYNILQGGAFHLSSAGGTGVEQQMQDGRMYYLSLARSPSADYTISSAGNFGVVFNLNGNWLNARYRARPVDYWERSWVDSRRYALDAGQRPDRTSEQEDRVLSNKPTIPIPTPATALITGIHILVRLTQADFTESNSGVVRGLIFEAKRQGIPVWLYSNKAAWLAQDTRRAEDLAQVVPTLTGQRRKPYVSRYSYIDDFKKYRELYYARSRDELSKAAADELYQITYYDDRGRQLDTLIHNEKKNNNAGLNKLMAIFVKLGIRSGSEFIAQMKNKWKNVQ